MILDVFSAAHERNFKPYQRWYHCPNGGFWHEGPHIVLEEGRLFPDHVIGRQIAVITPEAMKPYYLWDTCYTQDRLMDEAQAAGFRPLGIYGNVAGAVYGEDSDVLAIVMERTEEKPGAAKDAKNFQESKSHYTLSGSFAVGHR